MPLNVPTLDDRSYQDLLREARARIAVHNPEWTNFNDSDPGMTLVQLFAFLTESLLYRANQIPERNRRKFLTLLGIPLQPAAAAQGFVTIRNERGPLGVVTLDASLELRAGPVAFRSTRGLDLLPIEAQVFYKRTMPTDPNDPESQAQADLYELLYADLLDGAGAKPAFYQTTPLPPPLADGSLPTIDIVRDTIDRSLWIALLARRESERVQARSLIANKTITVGVMPQVDADDVRLPAGALTLDSEQASISWSIANVTTGQASYTPLQPRTSDNVLAGPGLVELMLPAEISSWEQFEPGEEGTGDFPPALADANIAGRVVTWLRLQIPSDTVSQAGAPRARISWLDINATRVEQRVHVQGELLSSGNGAPSQTVTFANTPVIPDTVLLTVDAERWYQIDDLLAADPEIVIEDPRRPLYRAEQRDPDGRRTRVYTLDAEAGLVTFGDGMHGRRPRAGAKIVASYAFGGGRKGNVGVGAINRSPQIPAGFKVSNPLRTWGGDDTEDVATAERRIPQTVQHHDRLVSMADFADITRSTPGVDIGRVEVLPLYDPVSRLEGVPGIVTVMAIPRYDPRAPDAPMPDRFFLDTICRYLQPRRLITTELHLRGPEYVDVLVSVAIRVMGGRAFGPVREAVRQAITTLLSPLAGGRDGQGWPLDTPVLQRELEAIVARVDGVRLVVDLLLGQVANNVLMQVGGEVGITLLQLPRLVGVEVAQETAAPLQDLLRAPTIAGAALVPIPVVPKRC